MQKINQTAFPEKEEFAKKNCPCRSDLADIVAYPYPVGELQRRVVKPMGAFKVAKVCRTGTVIGI